MVLLASWLAGVNSLLAQIPAFPGAEGAGAYAVGGRLGDVYHVTNTNASGTGSLAYGLTTGVPSAGRTIVFDVSGYAHIAKELRVTAAKITIAGQTAPGDGFGLKDGTFRVSSDEFVVRHLRFRNGESADSVDLDSGSLNSIFDHCDVMFSTDENMSSFGSPPENLTFQWGLNAWGLESHSCGGLWDQNHATCHHSLWAHNHTRNPKARPSLLDWSNNVTFDWDIGFILADSQTPANWNANVVGNYFIAGTSGKTKALEKGSRDRNGAWNFHVWLSNNRFDGNVNGQVDGTDTGYGMLSGDVEHLAAALVNTGKPVTVDDPLTAYKKVISTAGPLRLEADVTKPLRDEVAALLITETVNQTHHHVSSVAGTGLGNGGFGTLASQAAPTDTDRDGMPDFWETALGWNATTDDHTTLMANDGTILTGTTFFPAATVKGYTRLEEYLHWLAVPHATVRRNTTADPTAIDIDLRKFTSGFTVTPVFTLTGVVGGVATQTGTGGYLVHFVPTVNAFGRARFEFKVQDAAGSQWTQTFGLLVSAASLPKDLSWKGNGSTNVWDGSTLNFQRNATVTTFGPGDTVTFDDTGSKAPAVSIPANVAPATVTVNASGNYTLSGAGGIGSTGALLKRGTGSLTFTNTAANGFTGVTLDEGAIVMNNATALGTGALDLRGGALTLGGSLGNAVSINGTVGMITGGNTLSGTWSGDGELNANIGNNTFSVSGDMSAFSGNIKLGTSSGYFRFNGSTGSGLAGWDLGSSTAQLINRNGGATFNVGSLRGGVNTTLGAASAVDATSTYSIGGNNESTIFDGKILDGGNTLRPLSVSKVGTGALILTGASSYLGATTVSTGELIVNGSLSTTPVTVASGAKLRGNGSLTGSLTMQAGSQLSPGAASGLVGTLTLGSAGLNLQGGTLSYQLSNSPTGANDKVVMTGGALNLSGTNPLTLSLTDGVLGAGTYDLISGGTSTVGTAANVSATFPTGGRQTFALAVPAGKIQVVVTGNAGNLTWVGNQNAATWDLTTTANFTGATPGTFYNFDAVTFDDTSIYRNVTLTGSLAPRSTTVNTTAGYTFGGTGALAGGSLTKMGNGTLTIANGNSWAGNTIIAGGVIQLGSAIPSLNAVPNNSGLGSSVVTLQDGSLYMQETSNLNTGVGTLPNNLIVATTGTLRVASRGGFSGDVSGSGTLTYYTPYVRADITGDWSAFTGQVNVVSDGDGGDFRIASSYSWPGLPLAAVNLADRTYFYFSGIVNSGSGTTIEIGELSGTALSFLRGGPTGGRNFTYRIGGRNTNATFAGKIGEQNTSTTTQIVKTGTGNWTLSGPSAWQGSTTVEAGTLTVSGSIICGSTVEVEAGATLCLAGGTISADAINVAAGASLCGGGTLQGDLNNDGTLTVDAGTLAVTGDVVNNGTMRISNLSALTATGAFVNNGTLDLLTSSSSLPANLENNGTVIDSSGLNLLSSGKAGAAFSLTIKGYSGHTYQLQRTSSTALSGWVDIGAAQSGTGGNLTFTDTTGATLVRRFYRVKVAP